MTSYESDADLVARNIARIERVQHTLRTLQKQWEAVDVHMESADGDIQLSVNHKGRLMSLSLASGCTTRYTNEGLEQAITTTLRAAVDEAAHECRAIEEAAEESAAEAAKLVSGLVP